MAMNKVEICGVDTSTLPVISNERMRELFPLVHSGDLNAREEFIRGNLRLVLSVIQRFSPLRMSGLDLQGGENGERFEMRAFSACSIRFSRRLGCLISLAFASSVSRSP